MPSAKNQDYDVEKIVSKKPTAKVEHSTSSNGKVLLVKLPKYVFLVRSFLGFPSSENTWEPEDHMVNCQETLEAFEAEELEKAQARESNSLQRRTSSRPTRSSSSPSKSLSNRTTRSSNRASPIRQSGKRTSTSDHSSVNGEDEKKSSSKRVRKDTTDTEATPSIESDDHDVLDTAKLDQILDVRRNKTTAEVEYHIQVKRMKKSVWISSDRLTEDYTQQVVDFLEEKYV